MRLRRRLEEAGLAGFYAKGTILRFATMTSPVLGLRGFVDFNEHWNLLFAGDGQHCIGIRP